MLLLSSKFSKKTIISVEKHLGIENVSLIAGQISGRLLLVT